MAIWQYQIFLFPKEEIDTYINSGEKMSYDELNEIAWWKYRNLSLDGFSNIEKLLPIGKSWSDKIILFGNNDSNCLKLFIEENKIIEVSARIDLRSEYRTFIQELCNFAQVNRCVFVNYNFEIIEPNINSIEFDINNYPIFKSFLDKLR